MKKVCYFLLVAVLASAGVAHADVIPVDLSITVNGNTQVLGESIETDSRGAFGQEGSADTEDYTLDWQINGDVDPSITVSGSITNLTNSTINVAFLFATPVVPVLPPSGAGGSFGGSVTDGNGDGVTLSDTGSAVYSAQINGGTTFHTLANSPFTFTSAVPFGTANLPVQSFGIPGLTEPGPGVIVNDMGILVAFSISPHDAASFTANFVLQPRNEVIPEPATLSLLSLGLAGFAGRAIRKMRRN